MLGSVLRTDYAISANVSRSARLLIGISSHQLASEFSVARRCKFFRQQATCWAEHWRGEPRHLLRPDLSGVARELTTEGRCEGGFSPTKRDGTLSAGPRPNSGAEPLRSIVGHPSAAGRYSGLGQSNPSSELAEATIWQRRIRAAKSSRNSSRHRLTVAAPR